MKLDAHISLDCSNVTPAMKRNLERALRAFIEDVFIVGSPYYVRDYSLDCQVVEPSNSKQSCYNPKIGTTGSD